MVHFWASANTEAECIVRVWTLNNIDFTLYIFHEKKLHYINGYCTNLYIF